MNRKTSKYKCEVCNIKYDDYHDSDTHDFNFILWEWNNYRKALVKNRDGVSISQSVCFKSLQNEYNYQERKGNMIVKLTTKMLDELKEVKFKLVITNDKKNETIYLINIQWIYPDNIYKIEDPTGVAELIQLGKVLPIPPKSSHTIYVSYKPTKINIGDHERQLVFKFQTAHNNIKEIKQYTFFRNLRVTVQDIEQKDVDDGVYYKNEMWEKEVKIIPSSYNQPNINDYPIPGEYLKVFATGFKGVNYDATDYKTLNYIKSVLCNSNKIDPFVPTLTQENYARFFHILLWMDEVCQAENLKKYNMSGVHLKLIENQKTKNLIELEVKGLAEKRPSLIVGDTIIIRLHGDTKAYEGYVKTVNDQSIWIHNIDHFIVKLIQVDPKSEFDVAFKLGRLSYERKHKAIDNCTLERFWATLFPTAKSVVPNTKIEFPLQQLQFYDRKIISNPEQRMAVRNILNGTSFPAPYIVFGPPGTGKTCTIVEAILQIKKLRPKSKILICAPANAACDMLTIKLIPHCKSSELLRIHASSRSWDDVPKPVRAYSNHDEYDYTVIKPYELSDYRIIITTLVLIGKYVGKYVPDYVIIDEAAQAMEPEADIAISALNKPKVILAGDPKQLGPICGSKLSDQYGLSKSILERLMQTELYRDFEKNNFISMLKLNYRAHPQVLAIPNTLFYDGKLKAVSVMSAYDPIATLNVFNLISMHNSNNSRGFPVEFHSVIAEEKRQGKSPSYFNTSEIEMVVKCVEALIRKSVVPVNQQEIGIISPYIRQVHRIKEELKFKRITDVEVGTTETFQGREKRVIIISTVRGQTNLLLYDRKYNLGFVENEKRMNVALTRAKSKLIVIGNPTVLNSSCQSCKNWRKFIRFCEDNNSSFGTTYQQRTKEVQKVIISKINSTQLSSKK